MKTEEDELTYGEFEKAHENDTKITFPELEDVEYVEILFPKYLAHITIMVAGMELKSYAKHTSKYIHIRAKYLYEISKYFKVTWKLKG